ncbi:hypothetical protein [Paenibacillus oleatilyticus]|uniref:Uncharacterized protein n=1 Tax=Paenibacillus oleatilyticus TaxID=2594886 RepID=A0ABV4V2X2_9BACL
MVSMNKKAVLAFSVASAFFLTALLPSGQTFATNAKTDTHKVNSVLAIPIPQSAVLRFSNMVTSDQVFIDKVKSYMTWEDQQIFERAKGNIAFYLRDLASGLYNRNTDEEEMTRFVTSAIFEYTGDTSKSEFMAWKIVRVFLYGKV